MLRSHLDELDGAFLNKKLRFASDKYLRAYSTYHNDYKMTAAEIDRIETAKIIARANYWGVPVQAQPNSVPTCNLYWYWCQAHGKYYLSTEGRARLRRETNAEIETRFKPKPWVTCLALGIIVICLFIFLLQS